MSYQVLARKWRPRNFQEMVGQEHVLRALTNALDSGRLHHAFLFTGTRGVGKTTLARILAKSLNCETGVGSKPCGTCQTCREIDEGRFVDLIEVDAASRTKVEDTRDLLDNVQYAPTRGRYKVYLIDEVHMLSNHSFNALLKTLEEPPPHVKFLLATTDPQKLPVTILSRCLQFNLKRLLPDVIAQYLQQLLSTEQVDFDAGALKHLARAADGSMRDALSLLDQAIAFGGGRVGEDDVRQMLGSIEHTHIYDLLQQLADRNAEATLQTLATLREQAADPVQVLQEVLSVLHHLAILQQVPAAYDEAMGDEAVLRALADALPVEDVQLFYQIGLLGRRDLPYAPDPAMGLEMVILRMLAFRPADAVAAAATPSPASTTKQPTPPATQATPVEAMASEPTPRAKPAPPVTPASAPAAAQSGDWPSLLASLEVNGMLQQLAMNCSWQGREGDAITLVLDPSCANLLSKERHSRLQEALQARLGATISLEIQVGECRQETPAQQQRRQQQEKLAGAQQAIAADANVQKIIDTFGAHINTDTIQPVD